MTSQLAVVRNLGKKSGLGENHFNWRGSGTFLAQNPQGGFKRRTRRNLHIREWRTAAGRSRKLQLLFPTKDWMFVDHLEAWPSFWSWRSSEPVVPLNFDQIRARTWLNPPPAEYLSHVQIHNKDNVIDRPPLFPGVTGVSFFSWPKCSIQGGFLGCWGMRKMKMFPTEAEWTEKELRWGGKKRTRTWWVTRQKLNKSNKHLSVCRCGVSVKTLHSLDSLMWTLISLTLINLSLTPFVPASIYTFTVLYTPTSSLFRQKSTARQEEAKTN